MARSCTVLAPIAMQNIKEIHCSISEKYGKTLFDQKIDNRVSEKMSKNATVLHLIPS